MTKMADPIVTIEMENGDIGVLFEPNTDCKEILFASFSPEWVTGGEKDI